MITKEEFLILYEKMLAGRCTPEEKQLLEAYSDDMVLPDDTWDAQLGDKEQVYRSLKARMEESMPGLAVIKPARRYLRLKVAACFLVLLSTGILVWRNTLSTQQKATYAVAPGATKAIYPGGNKAYLTMADGTVISLNDAKNGNLSAQAGTEIYKLKDGVVAYNSTGHGASSSEIAWNTIHIPRGGQYQVILADGTKVWLNSASSLRFPAAFTGAERTVELSGEGYFEVADNAAKPFKVNVSGMEVQVLGTHFNVMAYNDEPVIKTTLLEGSVKLHKADSEALLKPGEQGVLHTAQQAAFAVRRVEVEDAIAWKNGLFVFNNEEIETIMKRIARWYDVEVVFPAAYKTRKFGGTISRFENVTEVLKTLELTGTVHFKTEGRKIVVTL